jgi:hypothetical protein
LIRSRTTTERRKRLERIFCALPEVEVAGSQHRSFSVRRKRLAYYLNDHHGDGIVALAVKTAPMDFDHYLELDPRRFFIPAYIGAKGFVGFRLDQSTVDWSEVERLARNAYRLQAPKTLVARLDGAPKARAGPRTSRTASSSSRLKRPLQPMPAFVRRALEERELTQAYRGRPAYQRNDYLSWISRAKREETRRRRLDQMLDELRAGDLYMKMPHRGGRGRAARGSRRTNP